MEEMVVPQAREGSWEAVFRRAGGEDRLLIMPERPAEEMLEVRGHRAIGVVYHPAYESFGNYVPTVLPRRYDAFLYIDESEALHPLYLRRRAGHEAPETFPTGV